MTRAEEFEKQMEQLQSKLRPLFLSHSIAVVNRDGIGEQNYRNQIHALIDVRLDLGIQFLQEQLRK